MDYTFKVNKYKHHQEALNRVEENRRKVHAYLLQLTIDYINKVSGRIDNNDFIQLRDSIKLRLESILFHYDTLASINISGEETGSVEGIPTHEPSIIALHQDFLFDSIIFNILSLYDYTSCLVKFLTEKNKQKKKLLWTKLAKTARGNNTFKNTALANIIDQIDREWVIKLGNYRAELIHYRDDSTLNGWYYNPKASKTVIHIYAPVNLRSHFKELKNFKTSELSINTVTLWIMENSFDSLCRISDELMKYIEIHRVIPKGKEIYTVKNEHSIIIPNH